MSLAPESSATGSEWVCSLIGSRLSGMRALTFFTPDHDATEVFQFQLEVDRSATWTVLAGRDGESISLRPGKIDPAEAVVIPDLGYTKIVSEISPELAQALNNQIQVVTLFHLFDNVLIGFRLVMTDGTYVDIFNVGDKLTMLLNQEHPLAHSEGVTRFDHK